MAIKQPDARQRLNSWKEIAAYLDREVRTVQRWEKREGLPVHRLSHEKGASVYAIPSELDEWRRNGRAAAIQETLPASGSRRVAWLAAVMVLLALALAGAYYFSVKTQLAAAVQPVSFGRVFAGWTGEGRNPHFIAMDRPRYLALRPDESEIYVATNGNPVQIEVIDAASETRKQTIAVPAEVRRLAVLRNKIFAVLADGRLLTIDAETKNTHFTRLGRTLSDIAITADGRALYAALEFEGIRRMELESGRVSSLPATACPEHLALTPDGKQLVVDYQCGGPQGRPGHDSVEIFDLASWKASRTITGLPRVGSLVSVSPDGKQIWADGQDACSNPEYDHSGCPEVGPMQQIMHVFRSTDGTLLRTLSVGGPWAFVPDSSHAIAVANEQTLAIDTTDFIATETLPVRTDAMVFAPTRQRAFAALEQGNAIAAFDIWKGACAELLGLTAHWPADGNAWDVAGGNLGKLQNGAKFGKGQVGAAFEFDGHGAFAELPSPDRSTAPNGDATTDFWMKLTSAAQPTSIITELKLQNRSTAVWRLRLAADGRLVYCGAGTMATPCSAQAAGSVTGTTHLQPGAWYHVALVRRPRSTAIWLNGRLDASAPANNVAAGGPLLVGGGEPAAGSFNGLIDEIELYTRALSPPEIARLYNAGKQRDCLKQ